MYEILQIYNHKLWILVLLPSAYAVRLETTDMEASALFPPCFHW